MAAKDRSPGPRIDDPQYWRARAETARRAAAQIIDTRARDTMLEIARNCEELARRTRARLAAARSRKPK